MKLEHDGWIVVADGERALFLRNEGDEEYPNLEVFREQEQDNPPTRDQAANRAGRFNDGPNVHRSAVADSDWHQLGKERFAKHLADMLYKFAHSGRFDQLILVAPPLVLGEMRKEFHEEVSNKIIGEINKTLTNHPVDKIEDIVFAE